jgi:putative endonuclease
MYYVYMIRNSLNKLYIGITQNPAARTFDHNHKQGANFTKYKMDFKIVFLEKHSSLKQARTREVQIKKWRREKKEFLIERYSIGLPTHLNN